MRTRKKIDDTQRLDWLIHGGVLYADGDMWKAESNCGRYVGIGYNNHPRAAIDAAIRSERKGER